MYGVTSQMPGTHTSTGPRKPSAKPTDKPPIKPAVKPKGAPQARPAYRPPDFKPSAASRPAAGAGAGAEKKVDPQASAMSDAILATNVARAIIGGKDEVRVAARAGVDGKRYAILSLNGSPVTVDTPGPYMRIGRAFLAAVRAQSAGAGAGAGAGTGTGAGTGAGAAPGLSTAQMRALGVSARLLAVAPFEISMRLFAGTPKDGVYPVRVYADTTKEARPIAIIALPGEKLTYLDGERFGRIGTTLLNLRAKAEKPPQEKKDETVEPVVTAGGSDAGAGAGAGSGAGAEAGADGGASAPTAPGTMRVTEEVVSGGGYLPDLFGQEQEAALALVDSAVEGQQIVSGGGAAAVAGEESFVSKYKWLLVGGALAAGYVYMHKQDPKKYPLPAELAKLVK